LLKSYVDAINKGVAPTISDAWESVVEMECSVAVEESVAAYRKKFLSCVELPAEPATLGSAHSEARNVAVKAFSERSVGADLDKYTEKLQNRLQQEYDRLCNDNIEASSKWCSGLVKELSNPIESKLKGGAYKKYDEFDSDRVTFRTQYFEKAKGPCKNTIYADYIEKKLTTAALKISMQAEMDYTSERSQLMSNLESAERRLVMTKLEYEKEKAALREQTENALRQHAEVVGREKALKEQFAEIQRRSDNLDAIYARFELEKKELQQRLDAQLQKAMDAERKMMEYRYDAEKEKLQLRDSIAKLASDVSPRVDMPEDVLNLSEEIKILRRNLEQAHSRIAELEVALSSPEKSTAKGKLSKSSSIEGKKIKSLLSEKTELEIKVAQLNRQVNESSSMREASVKAAMTGFGMWLCLQGLYWHFHPNLSLAICMQRL